MKKLILPVLASTLLFFTACDYVEFPNQTSGGSGGGNGGGEEAVQKVMIEEFTGQGCGNCPGGSLIAQQLADFYGDRVVLVSIHAGWFANGGNQWAPSDLSCQVGEDIDASFGISAVGNPNGMVNRKEASGSVIIGPQGWSPEVQDILDNQTPQVDINVSATYNSGSDELTADIDVDYLENLTGDYNIVVAVTENDIIAPQTNYTNTGDPNYATPIENNYPHKHVLRGHFNSTWGSALVTGSADAGTADQVSYTIPKGATWDVSNLYVIVYVYEVATNEVIQVEEVSVN